MYCQRTRRVARAIVDGYRETGPAVDAEWEARLLRYAGMTMLYRLCGSSPAPYLAPGRFDAIRDEGTGILTRGRL